MTRGGSKHGNRQMVINALIKEIHVMSVAVDNGRNKSKQQKGDVSWSNIHITNELREGLLVEVFIQHPGQISTQTTEQQEARRKERKW